MRRSLAGLLLFLAGCAAGGHPPPPELQVQPAPLSPRQCEAIFPDNGWQLVHSIRFTMPDNTGATVICVTTLEAEKVESALMTVEGLTLFRAALLKDEEIVVHQALPPFHSEKFAAGVMDDIQTIFRKPLWVAERGTTDDQRAVCRYTTSSGEVTDVYPLVDNCWLINKYSSRHELERTVSGCPVRPTDPSTFPDRVKMEAAGITRYSLNMKLLHAVPVQ